MTNNKLIGYSGAIAPDMYRKQSLKIAIAGPFVFLLGTYLGAVGVLGAQLKRQGIEPPLSEIIEAVLTRLNPFEAFAREFTVQGHVFILSLPLLFIFFLLNVRRFRDINPTDRFVWLRAMTTVLPIIYCYVNVLFYSLTHTGRGKIGTLVWRVIALELLIILVCSFWKSGKPTQASET